LLAGLSCTAGWGAHRLPLLLLLLLRPRRGLHGGAGGTSRLEDGGQRLQLLVEPRGVQGEGARSCRGSRSRAGSCALQQQAWQIWLGNGSLQQMAHSRLQACCCRLELLLVMPLLELPPLVLLSASCGGCG
jgi:hypothetical protein